MTARWKALGLQPPARLGLPIDPTTADLAVYALRSPGAEDPIEGIVGAVVTELHHLGDLFCEGDQGEMFHHWARRLEIAMRLLRRADGREVASVPPAPPVDDDEGDGE